MSFEGEKIVLYRGSTISTLTYIFIDIKLLILFFFFFGGGLSLIMAIIANYVHLIVGKFK